MTFPEGFDDPPWDAPLDVDAVIRGLPAGATMKGMFTGAVADIARRTGATIESARERYVPFSDYPLDEHCRVMVEAARAIYPDVSVRQGLRRIGRGAPSVMLDSTIGRVTVGAVQGTQAVVREICKAYPLLTEPSDVRIIDAGEGWLVVRMKHVAFFVDCHHVGLFEGTLKYARVEDRRVRIRPGEDGATDLLLTWAPA